MNLDLLWTEVDAQRERHRRDEGASDLQSPGDITDLIDGEVGAIAQEHTEGCPHLLRPSALPIESRHDETTHLPSHDQSTTNPRRAILRRKDRHRSTLETHTDAHQDACDEELLPGLAERASDGCN